MHTNVERILELEFHCFGTILNSYFYWTSVLSHISKTVVILTKNESVENIILELSYEVLLRETGYTWML